MSTDERTPFQNAYLAAALWSSTDESTPGGGVPLDANYVVDDFDAGTLAQMLAEAAAFEKLYSSHWSPQTEERQSQAGHDFWLTRNGHGAGFWGRADEQYNKSARDKLTSASEAAGEQWLSVGDDGKIYL